MTGGYVPAGAALVATLPHGLLSHPLPDDCLPVHVLLVWERLAPYVPEGAVWTVVPARDS